MKNKYIEILGIPNKLISVRNILYNYIYNKALNGICAKRNKYQCPNRITKVDNELCDDNIISRNNNKNFEYLRIKINRNHLKNI